MSTAALSPVRVRAELEPGLSRWLWLVKWFLAIPHFVVLVFLWIAFVFVAMVAFFAILFTGRYPRPLFEFNLGVLRWSWRVSYYAYGALGTDRYPPFTLAEVVDYPAHLEIAYPERLSRGLVLVKWWLLAIPQYLVVALLAGMTWFAVGNWLFTIGGLIGVLVLVAAFSLAFTGRYPRSLYDLILGCNRWILRVAAYASLMTDAYPPFRLDQGGDEPGSVLTIPRPGISEAPPMPHVEGAPGGRGGWTGGRITAVVIGSILALTSFGLLAGGGFLLWADRTQRDGQGFITTDAQRLSTGTFALTTTAVVAADGGTRWQVLSGSGFRYGPGGDDTIRIRVAAGPERAVFVGIARSAAVRAYLAGVPQAAVIDLGPPAYQVSGGNRPPATPADRSIWAVSSEGNGRQSIQWPVTEGAWTVVVMNADGSRGVDVLVDGGAKVPLLPVAAVALLAVGVVLLVGAIFLIAVPAVRASRPRNAR